jgi:hypothetical protein
MFTRLSLFLTLLLPLLALAQLGPPIISPQQNQTVYPGDSVDITFQYENLGTGNYTVDIVAINDLTTNIPVVNITLNHEVPDGNSTGFTLATTLNYTYSGWKVPRGVLNETFWLRVIEHYSLEAMGNAPASSVGGMQLLLHNSPASNLIPNLFSIILALVAVSATAVLM